MAGSVQDGNLGTSNRSWELAALTRLPVLTGWACEVPGLRSNRAADTESEWLPWALNSIVPHGSLAVVREWCTHPKQGCLEFVRDWCPR